MKLIQKISRHFDAQKGKQKKCSYIAMAENKHRAQCIIKASAFYKIQNFFLFLFKQTILWYMSKMYLWVLHL